MKKAISLIVSGEIIHYYIPDFLHFYRGWCSKNCQCLRGWKGIPNGFYWSCPLRYGGKTFSHLLFGPFFKIFPANCTCLLIYIHLSLLTFLAFLSKLKEWKWQPNQVFSCLSHPRKKKPSRCIIEYAPPFSFWTLAKALLFMIKITFFMQIFLPEGRIFFFHFFSSLLF